MSDHVVKPLPPVVDLLTRAWNGYKRRLRSIITVYAWASVGLLGVTAACAVLFAVPAIAFPPVTVVAAALGAVAFIVGMFVTGLFFQSASLEVATRDGVTPMEAFARAKKDWVAFTWTGVWTSTISLLAFGLFIIPGLVLMPAMRLAQYAFKADGKRDADALFHTHAAIRGRWWAVVWRMLVFGFLVGIVPQVLDSAAPSADLRDVVRASDVASMLAQAAYAFFLAGPLALVFGAELYKDVSSTAPAAAPAAAVKSAKTWTAVAIAGGIVGVAAVVATVVFLGPALLVSFRSSLN